MKQLWKPLFAQVRKPHSVGFSAARRTVNRSKNLAARQPLLSGFPNLHQSQPLPATACHSSFRHRTLKANSDIISSLLITKDSPTSPLTPFHSLRFSSLHNAFQLSIFNHLTISMPLKTHRSGDWRKLSPSPSKKKKKESANSASFFSPRLKRGAVAHGAKAQAAVCAILSRGYRTHMVSH